ncbi:MAG: hypothetical protein ACI4Q4_09820 [Oscillospiraceae bacterium]
MRPYIVRFRNLRGENMSMIMCLSDDEVLAELQAEELVCRNGNTFLSCNTEEKENSLSEFVKEVRRTGEYERYGRVVYNGYRR